MNYWFIYGIMNAIELTLVVIMTAIVLRDSCKVSDKE